MIRLMERRPRDARVRLHATEPDEGVHLVDVAFDGLGHDVQRADVGIRRTLEQMRLSVGEAIEHPIQGVPALGARWRGWC